MTSALPEILGDLSLSAWLVYAGLVDWRALQVPNWATVPPLLAVTLWRTVSGGWPVGLALAALLAGAQWRALALPSLVAMGVCLWWAVPVRLEVTLSVWLLCAVLWHLRVIGGADAKVVMALVALFPDGQLAWLLLGVWFAYNVVILALRRFQRTRSQVEAEDGSCPALPAVALAGLVYLWCNNP